jgi:Zn-dependent M28 family amino/carboxypeptidase
MRSGLRGAAVLAAAVVIGLCAQSASAATQTDTTALQNAVTVGDKNAGIKEHLWALQQIADDNNGTRYTGSQGHVDSASYVMSQLDPDYFDVYTDPFTAIVFQDLADPTLSYDPASPDEPFKLGEDFNTMEFSGSGNLTNAPIAVIDYVDPTTQASTSSAGCEDADFPAGEHSLDGVVAVIQRGTCDFGVKAENAQSHGAAGVIIFNEGTIGDADRQGMVNGTLGRELNIPVLETTYDNGHYLVLNPDTHVNMSATTRTDHVPTFNVVADTKKGRTDRTLIVGAHLDSVPEGPGINDDGSGTSTDLEVAQQMAEMKIKPVNRVRFMWFAGEEQGLLGSTDYADRLGKKGASKISAMLDFDMLASPNYAELIYDGNGSEFGVAGPNGSGAIENVFQKFFDKRGEYTERIPFDGRSDYDEFTNVGIPAGGIFTGAEEHKDAFEADPSRWGGVVDDLTAAGQYDPCYHQPCDTYANINDHVLGIMSDAVAHAVLTFAQTQSAINGTDSGSMKPYDWKGDHLVR